MGLYLCIFDEDAEVDGVEVGSYADFGALRDCIVRTLEGAKAGSRFPTFILHSDCDGEWSPEDCERLQIEIAEIISELKKLPPTNFNSEWQVNVAKSVGLVPKDSFESFIDIDGEFLLERIGNLVGKASQRRLPILFQ